jgi:hypothetical protein
MGAVIPQPKDPYFPFLLTAKPLIMTCNFVAGASEFLNK